MIELRLFEYTLPLLRPFWVGKDKILCRRGFLIRASDGNLHGWGEASPLPGFSQESPEEVIDCFRRKSGRWIEFFCQTDWRFLLKSEPFVDVHYPSLRFGLESAFVDLNAARRGVMPAELWGSTRRTVRNNGLVFGESHKELVESASQLADEGYTLLKIKVGRMPIDEEVTAIKELAAAYPNIRVRLDANRCWTLDEALKFVRSIAHINAEYIEEPVTDRRDLQEFCRLSIVPAALDESLLSPDLSDLPVAAWILKPGVHGGLTDLQRTIERAKERGILPVISSPLLSAAGLRMAAHLAAAFCPDVPMGLDTASLFAKDFLRSLNPSKGGVFFLEDMDQQLAIDLQELVCLI